MIILTTASYQYKMVQIPCSIVVKAGTEKGQEAAFYLQDLVNQMAADGWEFYRVDEIGESRDQDVWAPCFVSKQK